MSLSHTNVRILMEFLVHIKSARYYSSKYRSGNISWEIKNDLTRIKGRMGGTNIKLKLNTKRKETKKQYRCG